MQCMNDKCSNELTGRQKTYCSDKCRKAQTRTNEMPNPDNVRVEQSRTLTDATGTEHPRDYEGRRADHELLTRWAEGKGTGGLSSPQERSETPLVTDVSHKGLFAKEVAPGPSWGPCAGVWQGC